MQYDTVKKTTIVQFVIVSIAFSGFCLAQHEVTDLKFEKPPECDSDISRTLQSLIKIQGTGGLVQDGLYLITHYGDRSVLFQNENQKAIDNPLINNTWRFCSLFSVAGENSAIMGRNWDNQNVGSIIVSLNKPLRGYTSISFSRAIDLGFPLNMDLEQIRSSELGNKLLLTPFYATDGINEYGLAVSIAGVKGTTHKPQNGKELVFNTFLVRKILDQARTIDQTVLLVNNYIPFDLDKNSLNAHFLIADSSGRSVILEYVRNHWNIVYAKKSWQALTNKQVYNRTDAELKERCWRYRKIAQTLEQANGTVNWESGMRLLQEVAQKGTCWSIIYSPVTKGIHFAVYQNWNVIYRLSEF